MLDKEKRNEWQLLFILYIYMNWVTVFLFHSVARSLAFCLAMCCAVSVRLCWINLFLSFLFSSHKVAMLICAGFLIAWIPYAVVSVWSAFGQPDSVPIQFSVVPTLLAKSAAMYNPIIYQVIDCKFACCRSGGLKTLQKKSSLKKSR